MEADLIGFGRPISAAFLGAHVDEDRAFLEQRPREDVVERAEIVARDRTDVGDAEVLEELPMLGEVDDGPAEATRQVEDARDPRPGSARPSDRRRVSSPARSPTA